MTGQPVFRKLVPMTVASSSRMPSDRDLRWFGLIVLIFFGLVGALVSWQTDSMRAAATLWVVGAGVCVCYYAIRPLRRPLYLLWMALVAPIGWLVSHALMATVYYLILTPIALVARAFGHDPLARRFEPEADSYWTEEDPGGEPERYFRQS